MSNKVIKTTLKNRDIQYAISRCSKELKSKLSKFSTALTTKQAIRLIIDQSISHNAAPYGESNARSYEEIITSKRLNCGNQTMLIGYLVPEE